MSQKPFAIASRRSPLAQAQARHVQAMFAGAMGLDARDRDRVLPIETYVTTGDQKLAGSLAEIGGKGLFTKEIEEALLKGSARIAVHSMKDMPAVMPDGLIEAAIPVREDPRDCFISNKATDPWSLPEGATIGAASVRRIAQVQNRRPDLKVKTLRGNVGTRLEKLAAGEVDGTFLARAGLNRLGLEDKATSVLDPADMLPAVGQGALLIQTHKDDEETLTIARKLACPKATFCVAMERAFLAALDGSCKTPIGGLAIVEGEEVFFRGEILSLDGATRFTTAQRIPLDTEGIAKATAAGKEAARAIRDEAGADFMQEIAPR